jgi:hypothetical protein
MRALLCIAVAAAVLFFAVLPARSAETFPPTASAETEAGDGTGQGAAETDHFPGGDDAATAPPRGLEDIERGLEQTSPVPGKSASLPVEGERLLAALL